MERTLQEITIVSGSTRAKIAPQRGGLVTSLSIDNSEVFYFDKDTFFDLAKNVRGGIPLLFPNAGPGKGGLYDLPQHGFVRRMPWDVTRQNRDSITLSFLSNAETRINYPFDFELKLKVEVADNKLIHTLMVKNMNDLPMPTAYGIHPYFKIPREEKPNLTTDIGGFNPREINWLVEFDKPFNNPGNIRVQIPGKELLLESDPAIFKFVRIWHLAEKDFICIEPWTRDNSAINDPNQSLWVGPHELINLSVAIGAKIIK
jgi:galactose mutarotase-like enzyme